MSGGWLVSVNVCVTNQISDVGNMDEDLIQYYQFLAEKGDLQAQVYTDHINDSLVT